MNRPAAAARRPVSGTVPARYGRSHPTLADLLMCYFVFQYVTIFSSLIDTFSK